jgi:hypothetical protein
MIINNGSSDVDVEAVGYTIDEKGDTVLYKYGSIELVQSWVEHFYNYYAIRGLLGVAQKVRILVVEDLPPEEVDKMINICDYIGTYLKKQGRGDKI